jgi:hypothetical protein
MQCPPSTLHREEEFDAEIRADIDARGKELEDKFHKQVEAEGPPKCMICGRLATEVNDEVLVFGEIKHQAFMVFCYDCAESATAAMLTSLPEDRARSILTHCLQSEPFRPNERDFVERLSDGVSGLLCVVDPRLVQPPVS